MEPFRPGGAEATFDEGMAAALCGDQAITDKAMAALQQSYPQSDAVKGYYVPDLKAALALRNKDAHGALAALEGTTQFDWADTRYEFQAACELPAALIVDARRDRQVRQTN